MPHWLQLLAAVAGFLASWRWVVRPLRKIMAEAILLLRQIRDSSGGVQQLARDLHELAGAFIRYAAANQGRLDETRQALTEQQSALNDIRELVVDLDGDLRRLERSHRAIEQPEEDT